MITELEIVVNDVTFMIESTGLTGIDKTFWIRREMFPYFMFFNEIENFKVTNCTSIKKDLILELKKHHKDYLKAISKFNKLMVFS